MGRTVGSRSVMRARQRRRLVRTLLTAALAVALAVVGLVVFHAQSTGSSDRVASSAGGRPPRSTVVPNTTTIRRSPPYPVQSTSLQLFDPTRSTPERGSLPATAGRVVTTEILRPVGPSGPLPLVVFAHGWNSDPGVYSTLLNAWAAAGYLVAAPIFPDSADTLPGTPVSDYPDQALDLSFVITSLLDGRAGPIDPARIAVAGHSDGGTDVALIALDPAYADHRIRAYLSLSGEIPSGVDGPWGVPTPGTLLVAVGTDDEYDLLPLSTQVFQTADMVKVLLTVAGGDHLDTFEGASSQSQAVRAETVRFLRLALGPGTVTQAGLGVVLTPPPDPSITVTTGSG